MHFLKGDSHKRLELYLAAESEHGMNEWVMNLCRVLNLERQDDDEDGQANTVTLGAQSRVCP